MRSIVLFNHLIQIVILSNLYVHSYYITSIALDSIVIRFQLFAAIPAIVQHGKRQVV